MFNPPDFHYDEELMREQVEKMREDDLKNYPDPAFNAWLDESHDDGVTRWHMTTCVKSAWEGWSGGLDYVRNSVPS